MEVSCIKFKNFAVLIIFSIFLSLSAFAQENVISSVMISKSKDKPNSYELNIDSTDAVQYKSNIEQDGSVYFDLKNSVLAKDIGTIYDDVSNIDNVVVQQIEKNKVRIYVKGKNAQNTELVFVNSLFETEKTKKITINRPINEYQSVDSSEDLYNQEDIQNWDDNSFNLSHLITTVLTSLKESPLGIITIVLMVLVLLGMVIKILSSKLSQDSQLLIGLSNQKGVQESFQNHFKNDTYDLQGMAQRNEALKNAQKELAKAHQKYQDYLSEKYKKPKTYDVNPITQGIALNQYQKSTINPYPDQEVLKLNKTMDKDSFQIPRRPKLQAKSDFTSPYIKKPEPKTNIEEIKNLNKTNMKFLESVTKIYEQSGRKDLAYGLKNTLGKVKQ